MTCRNTRPTTRCRSCNQQPVGSAQLFYQSNPNFRGADDFSVQVRYSSSYTQSYTYNVTVR